MKRLVTALAAALISLAAHAADGQLVVNNRDTSVGLTNALFEYSVGFPLSAGYEAGLFLVGDGGSLTLLGPTTTFRTGNGAGLVNQFTATVPNATANMTFRLGAFEAGKARAGETFVSLSAFNGAVGFTAFSDEFIATPEIAPTPPHSITSVFPNKPIFLITAPEPTTMALAVLGGAALLFRRRK